MQLFEIGIRTKAESKKRLIEIAKGRRFSTQNQPKIWRTSEIAAKEYMRDHNITQARLVFDQNGAPHFSLVNFSDRHI